ncbi:hypothetical protein ACGFI9_10740 [Micromonospora sp. NPDC048930]|uniref:hypothetical protein n=1 Tax=Micromonospora sp. NPDC048930 TaxID=3364261 RepID=UPI0037187169
MTEIAEPELRVDVGTGPPGPRGGAASEEHLPSRTPWSALATLIATGVVVNLVLWDVPGVLRAVGVLGYLAVVPGLACARLIRIPDGLSTFVVGVALSLALGVLVAQGMIHLHRWSPQLGLAALAGIAALAALIELGRDALHHLGWRRND